MTATTTWIVTAFKADRGQIKPTKSEAASSENGARKKALAWSAREKGVAAIKVVADNETGEVSEAVVLEQHGQVPDDLAETIKGG